MKKQETVRMAVWTMILAVAVGTVVLRTALGAPAPVPAVVGEWNGAVTTGNGSLRVVLHVSQDKGGSLAGTLDSPDQGATASLFQRSPSKTQSAFREWKYRRRLRRENQQGQFRNCGRMETKRSNCPADVQARRKEIEVKT